MHRQEPSLARLALGLLALAPSVVLPPHAIALPSGPQVISGRADYVQSGNRGLVTQHTQNAIVNWRSFDIGTSESVRISQINSQAAMLARVTGGDPTKLLGQLQADGRLFLINERGILVGAGARIDTAAFLASSLDVSDSDFLRGCQLTFKGSSNAGIVNLGTINAREGNVLLFAHTVKNTGDINAPKGTAALAAGTEVLLASAASADFLIKANLPTTGEKTGVDNSGIITAAQARLGAAGGSVYELAVNQSGVVRANGTATINGRVLLTADGGTVNVSGNVSARNADNSGGEILIGGDYRGANTAVTNAARTVVTSTATLDASAAISSAKAGRVIVWANDTTTFHGSIFTTGAGGGFAEISGKRRLDFRPASVLDLGKNGLLLLDPDALYVGLADPGTAESFLSIATLQAELAAHAVVLDTSTSVGDITFDAALTWTSGNSLTVRSGNNININADLDGGTATLALYTGRRAQRPPETDVPDIGGEANIGSDATVTAGKLIFGTNALSVTPGGYTPDDYATSGLWAYGNLHVGTLEVDLASGKVTVSTDGQDNTIGAFHTTGTGTLQNSYVVNHHGDLEVFVNSTGAANGYTQFITAGNLTLKSGSSFSFAENEPDSALPGTLVFASTGGAFVNEAGAGVFGEHVRFLVYSSTTSATVKGGLVGTNVFNHAYDEFDYFDDSTSRFFFTALSGAPVLTYTANDLARYYGSANSALTYTATGWEEGVTNDVSGAPALSTSATQSSGVATYTIAIGIGSLASTNYDFAFQNGTLTINAAPLTITAQNATRRVNASDPTFSVSYSGFVLDQDASALAGSLAYATNANSGSPTGAYAITPSGLSSANYAITFVPGSLTIADNIALTLTAQNASRLYGATNPAFSATYAGFVGNDTTANVTGLQFTTNAAQNSGVGAYSITPFGATAEGYVITFVPATLTINPAPLTISIPGQGRTYGDVNNFTVYYNGLVNEDPSTVVSGLSFNTTANQQSSVGNYSVIGTGASAANYAISYIGGTVSVTPAPLTVSINAATRRYGDADPVFAYSINGLKNDDGTGLVSVNNLGSLATAEAGVGSYGIIGFPFVSSPNYTINTQATGTLTITSRPLTITANNATRIYGDANPALTASFTGLASFDTPALFSDIGLTTQATQSSGVGNWGITFGTVSNPNYTITAQFGTLAVTPAPITFEPLIELSRIYGRANPTLTVPEVAGLKLDDTVNQLGVTFEAPALSAGVGTYSYTLTTSNPNYSTASATGEFRVTPAPLSVTIGTNGRIYGDANPTSYNLSVTGLAFDNTAVSVIGVSNTTEPLTPIGTYNVAPVLNNTNYFIESFTGGAFNISPRTLTFTASNLYKIYGDANPLPTGTFTGLVDGDLQSAVVGVFGFSTDVNQQTSVGTYEIRPAAQLLSANYTLSTVNGEFRVIPALLNITIADATRYPGGSNPVFAASSVQGLKNQDTLTSLGVIFLTTATTQSDAGIYPINGQIDSSNYTTTFVPGELTVRRFEDTVDLTQKLDPSRLTTINSGDTPIFKDNTTTNETVEVEKPGELTIATRTDVDYSTAPLGKTDFANYLAGFANEMDTVKANLADGYGDFLAGKGKADSAYESMSATARQLLADWMGGTLSTDALRNLIASGDADASIAFGFIMPTLVNMTRAKDIADMTSMDRAILGRLADLTEQRKNATVTLAEQKYEAMLESNAKRAEMNGLANIFVGPGDFQAIVESATQEAVATYIGSTIGAAGSGSAAAALLAIPGVAAAIFPHAGVITSTGTFVSSASSSLGASAGGPAIAVSMAVVLAIRASQIGESIKNENAYNSLMASWNLGQEITSIAQLKSASMNTEIKLSTLMLSAELLSSKP